MYGKISLALAGVCATVFIYAQPVPSFTNFKGKVYSIPFKQLKSGYGPHIYEYEEIGEIDWEEINVSDRETEEPFPDVNRKTMFGMVLHSEVTIDLIACYEFSLNSDDGSLLWIDEKLVVNNKGDHQMTLVRDTVQLAEGTYPVKVWYHQAFPTRYGFILNSKYVGPPNSCEKKMVKKEEVISINSSVLFGYNSWTATEQTIQEINNLSSSIADKSPKEITIYGYTDEKGSEEYNLKLSQKRADRILEILQSKLSEEIIFRSIGMGEANPIYDNNTENGRRNNRRVEIRIK